MVNASKGSPSAGLTNASSSWGETVTCTSSILRVPRIFARSGHGSKATRRAVFEPTCCENLATVSRSTSTGHYIVAHPAGERDRWGRRFEDLYRSFLRYFRVRGFQVDEPPVPLVAVVLRDQDEFLRYAAMHGQQVSTGVLGFYSPETNRVALFDLDGAGESEAAWHETAGTIIHEATHQTAFNTGIHSRLLKPPYWVAEGLGTLFEAKGIWDSSTYRDPRDRINRGRLSDFRRYAKSRRRTGTMLELVSSDALFQRNPAAAYAEAWSLTYWLNETRPRQYGEYLRRTVERADQEEYTSQQRIADFATAFGDDFQMLEAHFLRFMREVK